MRRNRGATGRPVGRPKFFPDGFVPVTAALDPGVAERLQGVLNATMLGNPAGIAVSGLVPKMSDVVRTAIYIGLEELENRARRSA